MPDFTHLHVHSHYSLLDGLGTVPRLLKRAQALNMNALALTDHGVLYGAVEFSGKAKKAGIKPIVGCELYIAPRRMTDKVSGIDKSAYHLVVLCKNKVGYKNLLKLVSAAHLDGYYYKPRVDKEFLRAHSEGLICLTACLQSEISKPAGNDDPEMAEKALLEYADIFGRDNIFVELQHHPELQAQMRSNKHLIEIAKRNDLPLIATNDVHYLEYKDAEAQDALLCIQTGKLMSDTDRMSMKENNTFIDISMSPAEEMAQHFNHVPEAITNTRIVVDKCDFEMETGRFIFPAFPVPQNKTPHQHLTDMCTEGMWTKIVKLEPTAKEKLHYPSSIDQQYITRVEYELGVIEKTGFSSYMLMVADYCLEARRRGIFINTRGSAAGSLVAYLAGITDVDPLPYKLIFERFLNPERINWPDVDLDIADVRRGELIEYVTQKYGAEKVAQIITFGTIAAKNSIRDVGRVLGVPYSEVDAISKLIPLGKTLDESLESIQELKSLYDNEPQVRQIIDLAKNLEGVARHASVHAAGVVIADADLREYVPVQRVKEESGMVTQYSMYDLEAVGLVKMDFLGLANLTIIERALEMIKATRGIEIVPATLPLDDAETYKLLARGESSGVFQLESDGMKRYLKDLKPTEIGDIIAMVALYRPGPMELIPDYVDGKHGKKKVTYLHPKLEPILKETYGIAVYQEQIIQIARDLCGFSYGEADVLRKAIGKKIRELLMEQRIKWVQKGVENGLTKALAEKLFDFVEPFARYGFNKAHATSYGIIAYQTAYLKTHFPSQFMAAWLTSEQARDMEKVSFALQECERMGLQVLPPDINESFADFGVVDTGEHGKEPIRFGLGAIKNVGHGVAEIIVTERKTNGPFVSLIEFIKRVDHKVINRKTMESLIQAGAFDNCPIQLRDENAAHRFADRNQLLLGIESILKYSSNIHKEDNGQMGLFGEDVDDEIAPLTLPQAQPTSKEQRLLWEKELLGIYISEHPLGSYKEQIGTISTKISSLTQGSVGRRVRLLGLITQSKSIITKSNQSMAFVKLEDTTGSLEIVVFPSILAENQSLWTVDKVIIVDGKVNDKDGSLKLIADVVHDISTENQFKSLTLGPLQQTDPNQNNNKRRYNNYNQSTAPQKHDSENTPFEYEQALHITVAAGSGVSVLNSLKDVLESNPGDISVTLHLPHNGQIKTIVLPQKIQVHPPLLHQVKAIVGSENCEIRAIKKEVAM